MSGVTIADRCRPASPPAVRWIVSAQVSGASSRGSTQCASTRASIQDGPSGSADWTTMVRDGCRPVSAWIVAAPRSASSGRRAMTTRFITLVRAAMWRAGSPSISVVRSCLAQIRASSCSTSAMLWARADQRRTGSLTAIAGTTDVLMTAAGSDPSPALAVAGDHLVGLGRAPGAGVVIGVLGWRARRPLLDDRVDDAPRLLDLIGAREERSVALEGIQDEGLVRIGRVDVEGGAIGEVHRHRPDVEPEPGHFGAEPQHDPLVGLDADRQQVRIGVRGCLAEEPVRDLAELDRDLRRALWQALAGPHIERDARPAPVVDRQAGRDVRLRLGRWIDVLLLPVARHLRGGDPARAVLPADDIAGRVGGTGDRAQHLDLLIAQRVRLERRRRLHRDEADELEQVVLKDIP